MSRVARRTPFLASIVVVTVLATAGAAVAFWTATASGNASAKADVVNPGGQPTVGSVNAQAVTISWPVVTTASGRAVGGYSVNRYAAATGGSPTAATNGCAGTITALTCIEQTVPAGTWFYAVTPVLLGWTGSESLRRSATIAAGPSVSSFVTTNNNGIPGQGDTITITFGSAVSPASVCSSWGPGSNDTGNNTNVTVTLTKPASGHDTLTVSDPKDCPVGDLKIFAGSSLDLGTTGYVIGAAPASVVFTTDGKCNGGHQCSQVTLNAAGTILTITLGGLASGTPNTSALANTGVTYVPNPGILGLNGVAAGGSAVDSLSRFF